MTPTHLLLAIYGLTIIGFLGVPLGAYRLFAVLEAPRGRRRGQHPAKVPGR